MGSWHQNAGWRRFAIALLPLIAGCGLSATPQATSTPAPSSSGVEPSVPLKSTATPALSEQELWSRLQQATDQTYAVLFRHAIAPGTGDPATFKLNDCSTQRNLSEAGRQQARRIGQAFRDRGILVTQVLSSQWCRCLETARLMDLGEVQPFPALNSFFSDRSTAAQQTEQVQTFLVEHQNEPGVIVMVTHQVNITALSGIVPPSGAAIVMQIDENQINILGQLKL